MLQQSETQRSLRRHALAVALATALLIGGVGTLAATSELSGAVIATGSLVVKSSTKKVQHPTGGVLKTLLVDEGSHVDAGQILLQLDDTVTQATLRSIVNEMSELDARKARLEAERDGAERIAFPESLTARQDAQVARMMSGEQKFFEFRATGRQGQKQQLHHRIEELNDEIGGLGEQIAAKNKELALVASELVTTRDLWQKGLIQLPRLNALQRDEARMQGERGQLVASVAQSKGKIAEAELQILQVDQDLRTDVSKELAEIRAKYGDLTERKVTAEDQLRHIDIRSPQKGIVHELAVHTKGGVIQAGEQIMLIVPDTDQLVAEVRVPPQDIDQVTMSQQARVRFPNFDARTTPEIDAAVSRIAADTTQDPRTGLSYYAVQVTFDANEASRLDGARLLPGMPIDVFMTTGSRTILSYLLKPVVERMHHMFREK